MEHKVTSPDRANEIEVRKKRAQLRAVATVIEAIQYRVIGPRQMQAIAIALAFSLLIEVAIVSLVASAHWMTLGIILWAPVFLLAYYLTLKFGTEPLSHVERLDDLLSKYEPGNVAAFRDLQRQTRRCQVIDVMSVARWLATESSALDEIARAGLTKAAPRFLNNFG